MRSVRFIWTHRHRNVSNTVFASSSPSRRHFSGTVSVPAVNFLQQSDQPDSSANFSSNSLSVNKARPSRKAARARSKATRSLPSNFFDPDKTNHRAIEEARAIRDSNSLHDLLASKSYNPGEIWVKFAQQRGQHVFSMETYQKILRRSVLPCRDYAVALAGHMGRWGGQARLRPHLHDNRLSSILEAMKQAGHVPTLPDYHFVLSHLAVVGDYRGANSILEDLKRLGHVPTTETFSLCFEALSHHAGMKISEDSDGERVRDLSRTCRSWQEQMDALGVAYPETALETLVKILALGDDTEAMFKALRLGYGFDVSNPDHCPTEYLDRVENRAVATGTPSLRRQFVTKYALKMVLRHLGQRGEVSKMMITFETLTRPLSTPPRSPPSNQYGFDEREDDDPVYQTIPFTDIPSRGRPSRLPGTAQRAPHPTTEIYEELIQWTAHHQHKLLAQHYFLAAATKDRKDDGFTKRSIDNGLPWESTPRPTVAMNARMFGSLLSLEIGDREEKEGLHLKWLRSWADKVEGWKRADIDFYTHQRRGRATSLPPAIFPLYMRNVTEPLATNRTARTRFRVTLPRSVTRHRRRPLTSVIHDYVLRLDLTRMERMKKQILKMLRQHRARHRQKKLEASCTEPSSNVPSSASSVT